MSPTANHWTGNSGISLPPVEDEIVDAVVTEEAVVVDVADEVV